MPATVPAAEAHVPSSWPAAASFDAKLQPTGDIAHNPPQLSYEVAGHGDDTSRYDTSSPARGQLPVIASGDFTHGLG